MKPARLELARRCWQAWPLLSKDLAGDELRPELATLSHSSLHKQSGKSFLSRARSMSPMCQGPHREEGAQTQPRTGHLAIPPYPLAQMVPTTCHAHLELNLWVTAKRCSGNEAGAQGKGEGERDSLSWILKVGESDRFSMGEISIKNILDLDGCSNP